MFVCLYFVCNSFVVVLVPTFSFEWNKEVLDLTSTCSRSVLLWWTKLLRSRSCPLHQQAKDLKPPRKLHSVLDADGQRVSHGKPFLWKKTSWKRKRGWHVTAAMGNIEAHDFAPVRPDERKELNLSRKPTYKQYMKVRKRDLHYICKPEGKDL